MADTPFDIIPDVTIEPTRFSSAHQGADFYPEYLVTTAVERFHGLLQVPVAGPPGVVAAKVLRCHAPYSRKVVDWRVRRMGEKPVLPAPVTDDPNEVLAFDSVTPLNPIIQPGGKHYLYEVHGRYIFYRQAAPPGMSAQPAATPVTVDSCFAYTLYDYLFDPTLLRQLPSNGSITIKTIV